MSDYRPDLATTAPHRPDPRPDLSTVDLVREAFDELRSLLRTEVALARDELRREVERAKTAAISLAVAALLGALALGTLLVAFAVYIFPSALPALIVALALFIAAAVAAAVGLSTRPRDPLHETRERLRTDVQLLKERVA
jgi:uncharacterized membrane protein YqjE